MRATRAAAFAAAVALAGSSGCSFFLVDRYHEPKSPGDPVHCTSSHKWPLIDGAVALAAYAASVYLGHYPSDDLPVYTGNAAGAVGIGFGVSALYGVYSVHKCKEGLAAAKAPAEEVPVAPSAAEPEAAPVPEAAPAPEAPPEPEAAPAAEPEPVKATPTKKHKKKKPKKK